MAPLRFLSNTLKMNAYAAVIGTAMRLQGGHRPMPAEVEYAKPPVTDDPLYNDSHYFNFFDHDHGIGAFTRIGKLANRNASIGLFFIYLREGQAFLLAQSEHIPRDLTDIRSGPIRYEIVKPLEELRIVSRAKFLRLENPRDWIDPVGLCHRVSDDDFVDVDVDITFSGWGKVHNAKKLYARGLARRMIEKDFGLKDLVEMRNFASEHYEQAGSYTGTIRIGGRTIELRNATGHRDHSWGCRNMTAAKSWTWLTVQFEERMAVNVASFKAGKLDIMGGHIFRNDRNHGLREIRLDTEFEKDGMTQKSLRFSIEDTTGFRMEVEGRVVNPIPIVVVDDDTTRSLAFEAMTEYTWQGRKAYGISEYVHRIDKVPTGTQKGEGR
jgi:hypothetical protein